jgi:hypothetical protein
MRKFLVIEEVTFFNTAVFLKDDVIEVDDFYQVDKDDIKFPFSIKDILVDKRFQEIIEPKQELKWFDIKELEKVEIVKEHKVLMTMFLEDLKK